MPTFLLSAWGCTKYAVKLFGYFAQDCWRPSTQAVDRERGISSAHEVRGRRTPVKEPLPQDYCTNLGNHLKAVLLIDTAYPY